MMRVLASGLPESPDGPSRECDLSMWEVASKVTAREVCE